MLRRSTNWLVVHCAATRPDQDIGRAEIDKWHKARGWSGIGYHYVIRRDGSVEVGRPVAEIGAHVEGHNSDSVGICLVGGLDRDGQPAPEYTAAQWSSLHGLLVGLHAHYPAAAIVGHRDFPGVTKACPSFDVSAWLIDKEGLSAPSPTT